VAEQPAQGFADLLRQLRVQAQLTQEELAEAAGLSPRSVSDLERGIHRTARKDTAVLLAGVLGLAEPVRGVFVAAAQGQVPAAEVLAAVQGQARGASAAAATRTLPRDAARFTGRERELGLLLETLTSGASGGGAASVFVIDGMAGIGKTTLAVHAAHQLAASFPDGQFFLPLHAHTPGQRPVQPADALASLLLTAGVAVAQIPVGVDVRAARWRDCVAGKKILLLLDDAAGHEQVRPLVPGTAGSVVLITSRRRLTALEDATVISLDVLPADQAAVLLVRLAARPGIGPGDAAVREISRLCGYLPLAIGMLARQLSHHPAWTAASLAADLAAAADRLAVMRAENLSVAAAFDLSYQDLTEVQQRLFCRLGLYPGPSIDAYAAAALDGTSLDAARRHLDELYDLHLLAEPAPGRYSMHDLLHEHARALAAAGDPADASAAAGRLLDYYAHTAAAAGQHIATRIIAVGRPPPGDPPAFAPQLTAPGQGAAWLEAERPNLHAAVGYAAACGRPRHAIAIAAAISGFLFARGHWDQSAALHQAALATARQAGDQAGQADALNELGNLQWQTGNYPAAAASLTRALNLYRGLGDRLGQASALNELGRVQTMSGDHTAAAASCRQALGMFRDIGHRAGQAMAINYLGVVQWQTGNYPAAAVSLRQALGMFRDLGHQLGQAVSINNLGAVQYDIGDYRAAAASFRQALSLHSDLRDQVGLAMALVNLGIGQRDAGDHTAAAASLTQALGMFRDWGDRRLQATTISNLGEVHSLAGDHTAAAASYQQALGMFRDIGHRAGQAGVLNKLGELLSRSPDSQQARGYHAQALAIARDISAPLEEARALEGIGRCLLQDGSPGDGAAHLQQALAIYQRIGAPDARRVEETLGHHAIQAVPPPF
jgi:tetratricopeptide (TPR) repeat protein/transcriptional regulator with XRE-family HTH domain